MKRKQLVLEHKDMMYHSRELVHLYVPREINLMFYTIVSLVVCLIALLLTLKINDVIKVNGIVRTETNNSSVNNIIAGQIETIFYKPGQFVEKGDVLFSLKKDVYQTVMNDLENEIADTKKELNCTETLIHCSEDCLENRSTKTLVPDSTETFVRSQLEEYFNTVDYMQKQIAIYDFHYQKLRDQPEILFNQYELDEALLELKLCQQELERYKASFLAENIQKQKALELNLVKLEQELIRTKEQYSFIEIKAPISGFVQEVSSLNVGDYVVENQNVLVIVPDDTKSFKVELDVPTKDIGEITAGMEVKYRLSAFPFFEYRGAEGVIESIDSDVRQGNNGQLFYRVCSDIDKVSFKNKKGIEYPLRAGIEVSARIVLEKISVIHFILRKMDFIQ